MSYPGYVFTSRRETPEEFRKRTGAPSSGSLPPGSVPPTAAHGPARRFRLQAGFAEHDERFGSSVTIEVQQDNVPTRDEAVQLVWPAIEEQTVQRLGEGDWRPSLNWLDVIELLGGQ